MEKFKLTQEVLDSAREVMSELENVEKVITLDIDEIEDYDFPCNELFGLIVPYNNEPYCFIIRFSCLNKNFICMGPGARDRKRCDEKGNIMRPPFFVRWTWYVYLKESIITYADPMMFHDDDISVTWFAGDDDHWPMEDIALIIEKLAINQNVLKDNILFFGSSGGGFSAVVLGTLIRNSKVLVNNAQFFVLNYSKQFVDGLFDLLEVEFNGLSREEITEKIKYRLDAIELFKKEKYAPYIAYYVNSKSKMDMEYQIHQLIEGYYENESVNTLNIILYDDRNVEKPHNPLPTPETVNIIKLFCKNYMYNDSPNQRSNTVVEKGNFDNLIINRSIMRKLNKMNAFASKFKRKFL